MKTLTIGVMLLTITSSVGYTVGAFADDQTATPPATTTPATTTSPQIKISFGALAQIGQSKNKQQSYFNLTFNDTPVYSTAESFKIDDALQQVSLPSATAPSDSVPHLSLENGILSGDGGVLNTKFNKQIPGLQHLLGTFNIQATGDLKSIVYQGGLMGQLTVLNWINPVLMQRHGIVWTNVMVFDEKASTASTGSKDQGLAAYEGYIGRPLLVHTIKSNLTSDETIESFDNEVKKHESSTNPDYVSAVKSWYLSFKKKGIGQTVSAPFDRYVINIGDAFPDFNNATDASIAAQAQDEINQYNAANKPPLTLQDFNNTLEGWANNNNAISSYSKSHPKINLSALDKHVRGAILWKDDIENNKKRNGVALTPLDHILEAISYNYPYNDATQQSIRDSVKIKLNGKVIADETAFQQITVGLSSSGWYQFTGSTAEGGNHFTNLLTADLYYYLDVTQKSWLRLSYEDGSTRVAPTVYNRFASLTAGFSF